MPQPQQKHKTGKAAPPAATTPIKPLGPVRTGAKLVRKDVGVAMDFRWTPEMGKLRM